jgi:hypothetical protein
VSRQTQVMTRGVARVTRSDVPELVGQTVLGLTQSYWRLGPWEWKAEGAAVKILRDDEWCAAGQRMAEWVAAGGSMYEYEDQYLRDAFAGKVALKVNDGGFLPKCGPPLGLFSDSTERLWDKVGICNYALGFLDLRPGQDYNGWFTHLHGGQWWADYAVCFETLSSLARCLLNSDVFSPPKAHHPKHQHVRCDRRVRDRRRGLCEPPRSQKEWD